MTVAGAVFAFVFLLSVAAALYRRIARLRPKPGPVAGDYNRLFDELPIPMYIYDYQTFSFLAVNDAAIEQYGYSREEFLSLKVTDIRSPEEIPAFLKFHKAFPENRLNAGRWLHRNKDGRRFEVQVFTHDTRLSQVDEAVIGEMEAEISFSDGYHIRTVSCSKCGHSGDTGRSNGRFSSLKLFLIIFVLLKQAFLCLHCDKVSSKNNTRGMFEYRLE